MMPDHGLVAGILVFCETSLCHKKGFYGPAGIFFRMESRIPCGLYAGLRTNLKKSNNFQLQEMGFRDVLLKKPHEFNRWKLAEPNTESGSGKGLEGLQDFFEQPQHVGV